VIFATVGTHTAPFDRLVRAVDALAATTDEQVVIQIGSARFEPHHAVWFRMTTSEEMARHIGSARVVITHAADSLLEAVRMRKPVIAVPRRADRKEHIDDHQVELAAALRARPGVTVADNVNELEGIIARLDKGQVVAEPPLPPTRLVEALRRAIREIG
jgi:UDP-N-acetylglucosamine transferase subunit ALG13